MSLRSRLLIVLVAVTIAVTVTIDAVTYVSLRAFLLQRVDGQLVAAHGPIVRSFRVSVEELSALAPGLFVEQRLADGEIVKQIPLHRAGRPEVVPRLPDRLATPDEAAGGVESDNVVVRTAASEAGARYRVATWLLPNGDTLVLALPLDELESTMRRLLLVELIVTGLALGAGVLLARSLITVGLRPLDDIATTAGAIAAGDLTKRVDEDDTTEVGRLGAALNTMLGHIEGAFAERRATEDRLRQFVADASHELRTPLTSIRAYAELFERGADARPEDLGRVLKGVESEAARMGVLVDDLLLLARLDQGRELEHQPVDLGALAAESVDAAHAIDPDRPIALQVEGSIEVAGDRVRLRQIVDNLLANVRAHTPPATPATVTVRAAGDDTAELVVADEGPGIPTDQQPKVFERFFRADPARARDAGGSGLGLAIVAAIAAAHGGRAGVTSAPTGGAEFRVQLPLLHS
jgi:two-component system OmpR family sensor kinase